jgi:hypothetical protein
MKAQSTIKRELQRVISEKNLAAFLHERDHEDWLFGAEQALEWVLGLDAMAPAKALRLQR